MAQVPDEVEQLIEGKPHVAHLATSVDDRPHCAPVWYRYKNGGIEITTTGQKLENIRKNNKVALSLQSSDQGIPE